MENFTWHNPSKIIFGKNTVPELVKNMKKDGVKNVLVLYAGKAIFKNGAYAQTIKALSENNINFAEIGGIKPNPKIDKVREAISRIKMAIEVGGEKFDAILPIGGGSVFDSAKAIAAGACYNGDVWDFFDGKAEVKSALPIYGVLTVSATSSEANGIAVITNPEKEAKTSMSSIFVYPKATSVDPTFQFSLPVKQTVNGGVDIIAHILERVLDGDEGAYIMDDQGYALIRSMMRIIPDLIEDPRNYDARAEYAWIATIAHSGFLSCGRDGRGDFSSHKLGHSLSLLFNVPHGASLSVMMPAWARYLYEENPVPFARLGENVFDIFDGSDEEKAIDAIEALEDFFSSIGAPVTLRELDIDETEIERIAENASKGGAFGKLSKLEPEDVLEIYKLAY